MAVSRAEVGILQTQVNMLETHIASLDNRLQSAGVFVPDYVDKQMAGVRVQVDVFQKDVQNYATEATAAGRVHPGVRQGQDLRGPAGHPQDGQGREPAGGGLVASLPRWGRKRAARGK